MTTSDDLWAVDSTPVDCARSRETVKRSDLAGWAEYGYCASHSRLFWGLRLHMVCTLQCLPIGWSLSGTKANQRVVLNAILETAPALDPARENTQVVIADKAYYGREFEAGLHAAGIKMLHPAREGEKPGTSTGSSNHCARSSSPPTPPSRANSTSDATEARPPTGSAPASPNASSPSLPPSGTTTTSAHRPAITDRPTTTETPPSAASASDQSRLVFAATETLATESILVEPRGDDAARFRDPGKAQK